MIKPPLKILCFILFAGFLFKSCLWPTYSSKPDLNRGWIDVSKIQPGKTTKEEFFLEFGNTFKTISDDEKIFSSTFTKQGTYSLFVALPPLLSPVGDYFPGILESNSRTDTDIYKIQVEFDENDVVKGCDIIKDSLPVQYNKKKWW